MWQLWVGKEVRGGRCVDIFMPNALQLDINNDEDNELEEPQRNNGKQQTSPKESDEEQQPPTWHIQRSLGV